MLSLEYDAKRNAPHWDRVKINEASFFLRLRVRNANGCKAAEDVQVLVAAYHAGTIGLEGRALEWSGLRARGQAPVTSLRVPPGLQRHVDLVQITPRHDFGVQVLDDAGTVASTPSPTTMYARLCVHPKPWGAGHRVPPGDHDVVLTLTAANADAISYRLTVSHNGDFSADLLRKPKRLRWRGPFAATKHFAKLALVGFRPSAV